MSPVLLVLVLTLTLPALATATTWTVIYDPEDDVDCIGHVVLGAASGDTILVGPGTYYEHISMETKTLTFLSTDGPEATILDGSQDIEGREGSILHRNGSASSNLVVDGFTFQNGRENHICGTDGAGGGICWCGGWSAEDRLNISNCAFVANHAEDGDLAAGAGIFIHRTGGCQIRDCVFEDNIARWGGSAVSICVAPGKVLIRGCRFDGNRSWYRESMLEISAIVIEVIENTFQGGVTSDPSSALTAVGEEVVVRGNRFIDPGGSAATTVLFDTWPITEAPPYPYQVLEIVDNVFWSADEWDPWGTRQVRISNWDGAYTVACNAFVRTPLEFDVWIAGSVQAENNIFFESPVIPGNLSAGTVRCNASWPDSLEAHPSLTYDRNINLDPLFCDEEAGDLRLAIQSPCAPDNAPQGCGLIGALPAECDIVSVERVSWGAIKARFK